ncbi:MAG: hypothetical protein U0Z17_03125 [Bacteroidales bacterium]
MDIREKRNSFGNRLTGFERFDWDELSEAQQSSGNEYQFRLPGDISISGLQIKSNNFILANSAPAT